MYKVNSQPWPRIVQFYRSFAETISYLPEFGPDKEVLNIDFDHKEGQFRFEYQETDSPLYKRWKKACSPDQAFPAFLRFLKMKNSFFSHRDSATTV
jgi:hypothetical protein